ncbi:hypothetical protein O6H91_06G128800 [Diphasiastrum complanatum]|nr:hypothetical protein O6H91_06G128800 [Diphasiastrum complanatum]KAJ7554162.1 hypothetical protein O6H91_06G128800 [Diphasiastrum complanatum]KAJ7554164.1 hypothetical protein O6H91_06G128800 [Diphasiastrum complanatum]KAJ7554165.1 hypothetical protein O6H91_06G128800 [Diphasiastrum complanatum]
MSRSLGGREGDWSCSECGNLNYSFRSACNRCKQPKMAVVTRSRAQAKWLPRAGDWICNGCRNNNYAFRMECNKCGEPKDSFEIPADAPVRSAMMDEMARPRRPEVDYFWDNGNGALAGVPLPGENWQSRDWVCSCGFLNYSFDARCKQCHATPRSMLPAEPYPVLGTKRVAAEDSIDDWIRKRQNVGDFGSTAFLMPPNSAYEAWPHSSGGSDFPLSRPGGSMSGYKQPAFSGKGLKHWREGDWICKSCENHNYASRKFCNRCMSQKDATGKLSSVY